MFVVFERFADGKSYCLKEFEDQFEAECWMVNNPDATRALAIGKSWMEVREV